MDRERRNELERLRRARRPKKSLACETCGSLFIKDHGNRRYCSGSCLEVGSKNARVKWSERYKIRKRALDRAAWPRRYRATHPKLIRNCEICGRFFRKLGGYFTCSTKCHEERQRRKSHDRYRAKHPDRPSVGEYIKCRKCSAPFKRTANRHFYCIKCKNWVKKRYQVLGPLKPKGELQWLRKHQAQLRAVKRLLKNPRDVWKSLAEESRLAFSTTR